MKFYDGEFKTAKEKESIANAWRGFLSSGMKRSRFTLALYRHLSLHFMFIAHYNIDGFYEERFYDPDGRLETMRMIIDAQSYNFNDGNTSGCADLNTYIRDKMLEYSEEIAKGAHEDKVVLLKHSIRTAQEELNRLGART